MLAFSKNDNGDGDDDDDGDDCDDGDSVRPEHREELFAAGSEYALAFQRNGVINDASLDVWGRVRKTVWIVNNPAKMCFLKIVRVYY